MSLANEYEQLLKYLETEQPNKKKIKPVIKKESSEKIIEEFKDIPTTQHYSKVKKETSKFFSINYFEDLMRKKLIEEHISYQNYNRPYISVSELYNCMRNNYFYRKKYQVDLNKEYRFAYLYLINKVGNTVHKVIQELYQFKEVEKVVLSEKYKIKGKVDGVDLNTVYEIKTIDVDDIKKTPVKEHIFQGMIYAYILNTEYKYKIKNVTLIYVTRNLKRIYPIDIKLDMKLGEKFVVRAPLLKDALSKNKVIDPIGATQEMCKWCSFKDKYCNVKIPKNNKIKQKEKIVHKPKSQFLL